jgi:tRNA(Ile)-lysidine synthase
MDKLRPINKGSRVLLVRPLLWARRSETEEYCAARKIAFLMDEMNEDESFARVRVRKHLLPVMRTFNNRIVEALARTAELLREDTSVLANSAEALLKEATIVEKRGGSRLKDRALNATVLAQSPPSLRRQAIRKWLSEARGHTRRLEMVHILAVERLLQSKARGRTVELPDGGRVVKQRGRLQFRTENN